jgi:hypothetical protein
MASGKQRAITSEAMLVVSFGLAGLTALSPVSDRLYDSGTSDGPHGQRS